MPKILTLLCLLALLQLSRPEVITLDSLIPMLPTPDDSVETENNQSPRLEMELNLGELAGAGVPEDTSEDHQTSTCPLCTPNSELSFEGQL